MKTALVDSHASRAAQFDCATDDKCFVCGRRIGKRCFYGIHREEGVPVMLCGPTCAIQYIDSTQTPADRLEWERRDYENDLRLFTGAEQPWS